MIIIKMKTLDRHAAENMGHVAWIESENPQNALSTLFSSLGRSPYNFALWADANRFYNPALLPSVQAWHKARKANPGFKFIKPEDKVVTIDSSLPSSLAMQKNIVTAQDIVNRNMRALRNAHITPETVTRYLQSVFNHAAERLHAMKQLNIRATAEIRLFEQTVNQANIHVDGRAKPFRLLESFDCARTCIMDNKDFPRLPVGRWDKQTAALVKNLNDAKATVNFWEVPEGSLLLLSTTLSDWAPIVHSRPVAQKNLPRTLITYS